jgi:hypothetical protein
MDDKIISALIGGVAGALISLISSYIITRLKINQEVMIWNSDFAINYSKLLIENPSAAAHLARQFSVGLIIVRDQNGDTESKHFIPYQCKVSIGRGTDNDIIISIDTTVSRDHGVFFYRGSKVMFQEFSPKNKTLLNGKPIHKICHLKSGDTITIGETLLEFEELK